MFHALKNDRLAFASVDTMELSLLEKLRLRAALFVSIRKFFEHRQVIEVNTPILSAAACPEPNIEPLSTQLNVAGFSRPCYLQTSPEFAMKKLLAAGSGSIYQICPVFRDCDLGRFHQPEFTLLEWYRVGFDHHQLMKEVEALIHYAINGRRPLQSSNYLTYQQAFLHAVQLDPLSASIEDCLACCERFNIGYPDSIKDNLDQCLDLIISHLVSPGFPSDALTIIYDYPESQAALARTRDDPEAQKRVAERFEVYLGPVELANGFHELTDGEQQLARFQKENKQRALNDQAQIEIDMELIAALESGMPNCAGVALGLERLLMVIHKIDHINNVVIDPLLKT